jgi:hypothetical protein
VQCTPEVVLADAGYWHQALLERLAAMASRAYSTPPTALTIELPGRPRKRTMTIDCGQMRS